MDVRPTIVTVGPSFRAKAGRRVKRWSALATAIALLSQRAMGAGSKHLIILLSSDIAPYQQARDGIHEVLSEEEERWKITDYPVAGADPARLRSDLQTDAPRIVFALGTPALKLAEAQFPETPIVFCMVLNPQGSTTPNTTGVSLDIPQGTRLAKIREMLPDLKRLGLIYSSDSLARLDAWTEAVRSAGLKLVAQKIDSEKDFPDALKEVSWRIDAFLMIPDGKIYFPKSTEYLLSESLKNKFPVIGLSSVYTKAGALMSFDCDYKDIGRQAAEIAQKILQGARPENLPLATPRKINMSLNTLSAERLELKLPRAAAQEATETFGQ